MTSDQAPYFKADTLDDLMRIAIESIIEQGIENRPTKGPNKELVGVMLELSDPRCRLSRTETRGKPFSCLGELFWYLSGSNDADFITYYIRAYNSAVEPDPYRLKPVVGGGYGPRLMNLAGLNQLGNVIRLLQRKNSSRRAALQVFAAYDSAPTYWSGEDGAYDLSRAGEPRDVPCTCNLQFLVREGSLHMVVFMRSNDVYIGLPHDVFCFTMIQEIVARTLGVELGTYKHVTGSLHLYECNEQDARTFLGEGIQDVMPMPPMPQGDPWDALRMVAKAEAALRLGLLPMPDMPSDPYWADLVRLLQIHKGIYTSDLDAVNAAGSELTTPAYHPYLTPAQRKVENKATRHEDRSGAPEGMLGHTTDQPSQ